MKKRYVGMLMYVLALTSGTAYAQLQSPAVNPVVSDNYGNTAMGTDALISNDLPSINDQSFYNTAAGAYALQANTTGYRNTAFGGYALIVNTTGAWNSAFGEASLFSNISGSDLTAVGQGALYTNISGSSNTAVGFWSLLYNTIGSNDTAARAYVDWRHLISRIERDKPSS